MVSLSPDVGGQFLNLLAEQLACNSGFNHHRRLPTTTSNCSLQSTQEQFITV